MPVKATLCIPVMWILAVSVIFLAYPAVSLSESASLHVRRGSVATKLGLNYVNAAWGHEAERETEMNHPPEQYPPPILIEHGLERDPNKATKSAGLSTAFGLVSTVVLAPVMIYLAAGDGTISKLTLKMLDIFVSIFLAVLWFNVFSQFQISFDLKNMFDGAEIVLGIMQCLLMYFISLFVAYVWRDAKMSLITFCTCAGHYVAFAGISASAISQRSVSIKFVHEKQFQPMASAIFCAGVILVIATLSAFNHFTWVKNTKHHLLQESIEEMEIDVMGLIASFSITQALRHALTGNYPSVLLQIASGSKVTGGGHEHHTPYEKAILLGWVVANALIVRFAVPQLKRLGDGFWALKAVHFTKVISIMLVAWGALLLVTWQFHELYQGDQLFGYMILATFVTLICLAILLIMARVSERVTMSKEEKATMTIAVTGISLVAAWSWEHCFNVAFDVIGETFQAGFRGFEVKLLLATILPLFLLPTYLMHVKRMVVENEEAEHAHGEHVEHEDDHSKSLEQGTIEYSDHTHAVSHGH